MAWPHPKNDAFRERRGKVSCHPGEIRQLCLEMSGQGLKAARWRKKKEKRSCDIVPTGHRAVRVPIKSSLCERRGALRLPISDFGESISPCLPSLQCRHSLALGWAGARPSLQENEKASWRFCIF